MEFGMRTHRHIVSIATALVVALPCLGAIGCYREHVRHEVVVEPRHEEHEHVVVKREVEVRP
jgi:hypothetical protein